MACHAAAGYIAVRFAHLVPKFAASGFRALTTPTRGDDSGTVGNRPAALRYAEGSGSSGSRAATSAGRRGMRRATVWNCVPAGLPGPKFACIEHPRAECFTVHAATGCLPGARAEADTDDVTTARPSLAADCTATTN